MPSAKIQLAVAATVVAGLVFVLGRSFLPQTLTSKPAPRPPVPPETLTRAVAAHDEALVKETLKEQVDVNAPDAEGRTPLLAAIDHGNRQSIPSLLDHGANVDLAGPEGRTPLMAAAATGDVEMLRTLAPRSNAPDARDAHGRTAAHYAAAARQRETLEILLPLLPASADPNSLGGELLALAYDSGDMKMIETVLTRYSQLAEWTPLTQRALQAALISKDDGLLRLLLAKHAGPPMVEDTRIPLLAHAVVADDLATVQALLAAGADPNVTLPVPVDKQFIKAVASNYLRDYIGGDEGVTPLMLAAGLGRAEFIRTLLAAGADKNLHTKKHKMLALYFAARTSKPICVQLLLGRGPSPDELRVEISLAAQKARIIKNGVPILQTAVSTGRKGFDTPRGEYVVTDKKRSHVSSLYHVQMPFFMRLNCLDFGLHAGAVPNYPASHGCIRLPSAVAEKIFSEVPVGTMVSIN
jgi:ankyrin repeat protein